MEITITIPDEAVESIEQWLDSDFNIERRPDNKGQILNHRRIKDVGEAIGFILGPFIQQRMTEFAPQSNPELAAAVQQRQEAEKREKEARQKLMDRVKVTPKPADFTK